jgi:hypothetical protein
MATLEDHAELTEAFGGSSAGFLARFIDSVSLQQRWRITRPTLLRYEHSGLIPSPRKAFGKLWYPITSITAAETRLLGIEPEAHDVGCTASDTGRLRGR